MVPSLLSSQHSRQRRFVAAPLLSCVVACALRIPQMQSCVQTALLLLLLHHYKERAPAWMCCNISSMPTTSSMCTCHASATSNVTEALHKCGCGHARCCVLHQRAAARRLWARLYVHTHLQAHLASSSRDYHLPVVAPAALPFWPLCVMLAFLPSRGQRPNITPTCTGCVQSAQIH